MIEEFYGTSVIVQQPARTVNTMGGVGKTYSTRIAALKCRISNPRINETDEFGKMTVRSRWRLYCEASTTNKAIEEGDRIIYSSRTFEITAIGNPAQAGHHLEIDLQEVR